MRRGTLVMAVIYSAEVLAFIAGLSIGIHFQLGPIRSGALGAGIVVILAVPATMVIVRTRSGSHRSSDDE